jgi:hypothetical protein
MHQTKEIASTEILNAGWPGPARVEKPAGGGAGREPAAAVWAWGESGLEAGSASFRRRSAGAFRGGGIGGTVT